MGEGIDLTRVSEMEREIAMLRSDLENIERENEVLKIEKEKNQNIIKELTSWVNDLTSSLLGKGSVESQKIAKGLEEYKSLERKVADLKRELVLEKKKFIDLSKEAKSLKDELSKYKREMMSSSEGLLLVEKSSLQETLKQLSEEVEYLSSKNEQLIQDLRKKDFFDAYQNSLVELEKIREEYFKLLKVTEFETYRGDSEAQKKNVPNNFSIKTFFNCNKGGQGSFHGKKK